MEKIAKYIISKYPLKMLIPTTGGAGVKTKLFFGHLQMWKTRLEPTALSRWSIMKYANDFVLLLCSPWLNEFKEVVASSSRSCLEF